MGGSKKAAKRQTAAPAPRGRTAAQRDAKPARKTTAAKAPEPLKASNGARPASKQTIKKATRVTEAAPARPKREVATSKPSPRKAPARKSTKSSKGRARPPKPVAPIIRVVKVKQLDPITKCGPGTSVEQLFRVDEEANGHATVHLVFFDRHGWYCVHGPRCVAVADVHSHNKHGARAGGR